jgi:septum formation inhibitor-activating ATPase MinD
LNKGEPVINGQQGKLGTSFDEAARDLAGLPAAAREAVKSGLFGRLGGRR